MSSQRGELVYTEELGPVRVEVYLDEGMYHVFVVGDQVACFLGSSAQFEDCLEEISSLRRTAESADFQQLIQEILGSAELEQEGGEE